MKWWLTGLLAVALLFLFLSRPISLVAEQLPPHDPDIANGENLFHAGGCASCHEAGLAGGREIESAFGTFVVPNISSDSVTGIGGWSTVQFVNAMMLGVSPDGRHYYPAFPYTSYTRMKVQDVIDLKAYLDTLSAVNNRVGEHKLGIPWNIRRGLGLWKLIFLEQAPVIDSGDDSLVERGRYLAEGVAHCGECHTRRGLLGGLRSSDWLAGGPNPDGEGSIPNITPHEDGLEAWSESDIVYYLESGFTPDFDTVGGSMVKVQENIAHLPDDDVRAIAAYLKSIPEKADPGR